MIVMLSTSPDGVARKSSEIGLPGEQLLTPATNNAVIETGMFAVDNSCFASFDRAAFERLLEHKVAPNRARCRWVSAPDVVCNARRTLEAFAYWHPRIRRYQLPVALVAQNGIEDLAIPWERIACLFIGGDDKFKTSQCVKDLAKCAHLVGVWVHMGRVNGEGRRDLAESIGCDSVDGTGKQLAPLIALLQEAERESE